jgi:Ca2+-binding EF-hand superfamily protein
MEVYYERRRARTVISTWNQEFVPAWKDYRLIVSVAASYRSRTLKERYFRRGFRVFWELTAGARRVAMAVRVQRLFRCKRARERILIMRLKIRYQLETRARMGIDTRAFTAAALQAALASHEWVFVLFSMPWAPVPAHTKEAFCKTATTWSFIRQQGRRMVFGLADATEILSSPVRNLSLMSWFGLQPDQLPCVVGFWQGVGPSSSSPTDSVSWLATGEIRQLKRRFKAICDVDSTSTLALVWPAQTKDVIPPPAMSHLVRWIERLQQASYEATAVDLQSYIRGFLARRRTKRYRIITMHRRRQRVRSWSRELLSRWTDRKRQHASMVLQVWARHVHARRKFWIAFRLEVHLRKDATHRIQRSAVVYLVRLRTRRALVSLLATPQRYPNAPLCQVCLVDSRALARLHCHDCQQVYCAQCYAKAHRSGKRLLHLCRSIDFVAFNEPSTSLCKACEVRMSTRVCLTCGHEEALCTSCFEAKHTDEVSGDNLKENQGRRRPRRVWWSSVKFREHDWKRVNLGGDMSSGLLQDSPCLNALSVMERYAWQSSDMVVRKLHEAAQLEESIREREDRLLAIRVQQESILRDAFDRYDTDKSGAIDRSEFKRMFKEELCEPLSDALVDDAMKRMEKSGNGLVEFDELLAWFAEDALAKDESGVNQQADSRSLSMLKDALRAKRQMRRYKEKLNEFVPTVRVPKPQILAEALLSQLTEKSTQKKRTVPGFPSVTCLEHADFARKRKVFYRFVKEICALDWIDEDEQAIPIANAMHVFDESFVPRWNAGELTYDFYFDDESFEFEGELWQRKWIPDTKKYVFTTARRKTRKVDAHTVSRKRRKRFSLTRNAADSHDALPELTEIEETVEIIEQVDPRRKQMLLEEAQEAFKKADRDGSGYIDEHEFHRVLVLELCEPISKKKAKLIMKQLDADGSGKIDFHEFFQWYAVEKCQEYPMTPQMARARALLQTRRRAKATAAAAVHAGISGGLQLKEAVARKRKEQQLARDCKGAPPELIALLQEGFGKLLAEKALALHNQDVAFARKWLVDRKEQEELERVQAARARADTKARAEKMAREKKLKRRQRITTLRKQLKVLIVGPSKKEAHAARMQQALSNLDHEIQLVERQLAQ